MADLRPGDGGRFVLRSGSGVRAMTGFCDRVLGELPHLTRKEKRALRAELEGHIADHAEALEEKGLAPEEAAAKAEEAMGDASETAKALAQCYSRFWLWVGRGVNLLLAVAVVLCWLGGGGQRLMAIGANLLVRLDPEIFSGMEPPAEGWTSQSFDLRMEAGEQVIRVYRVDIDPEREEAHVYACHYPKNPLLRPGSGVEFYLTLTNQRGEVGEETGGISFMPGYLGWNYWERIVPIRPGDRWVYYTYDIYDVRLEIPLEVAP